MVKNGLKDLDSEHFNSYLNLPEPSVFPFQSIHSKKICPTVCVHASICHLWLHFQSYHKVAIHGSIVNSEISFDWRQFVILQKFTFTKQHAGSPSSFCPAFHCVFWVNDFPILGYWRIPPIPSEQREEQARARQTTQAASSSLGCDQSPHPPSPPSPPPIHHPYIHPDAPHLLVFRHSFPLHATNLLVLLIPDKLFSSPL